MSLEKRPSLPPAELLVIAGLVNRVCETDNKHLEPVQLSGDAEKIIQALDPLVPASSEGMLRAEYTSRPPSGNLLGETNAGQISGGFSSDPQRKTVTLGTEKVYRIGLYRAKKENRGKGRSVLSFEYFMTSAGTLNLGPVTELEYRTDPLRLIAIVRYEPRVVHLGRATLIIYIKNTIVGKSTLGTVYMKLFMHI